MRGAHSIRRIGLEGRKVLYSDMGQFVRLAYKTLSGGTYNKTYDIYEGQTQTPAVLDVRGLKRDIGLNEMRYIKDSRIETGDSLWMFDYSTNLANLEQMSIFHKVNSTSIGITDISREIDNVLFTVTSSSGGTVVVSDNVITPSGGSVQVSMTIVKSDGSTMDIPTGVMSNDDMIGDTYTGYAGKTVTFLTGDLAGETGTIVSFDSDRGVLDVTGFSSGASVGDTFTIENISSGVIFHDNTFDANELVGMWIFGDNWQWEILSNTSSQIVYKTDGITPVFTNGANIVKATRWYPMIDTPGSDILTTYPLGDSSMFQSVHCKRYPMLNGGEGHG